MAHQFFFLTAQKIIEMNGEGLPLGSQAIKSLLSMNTK